MLAVLLLLSLWAMLVLGSRGVSITMDEPYHIARGYSYLSRGRAGFWYFSRANNPPLLNAAQAALLYIGRPDIPVETLPGWGTDFKAFSNSLMPYLLPATRTEVVTRLPTWFLTVALAALVFRWAASLGGHGAGLAALFLLAFDPLVLANGRLATADLGVTALGTAALYCAWRWHRQQRWDVGLATGALIGLVFLTKYSSFIYGATLGLICVVLLARRGSRDLASVRRRSNPSKVRGRSFGPLLVQVAVMALLALLVIWAGFLFVVGQPRALSFDVPAPMFWDAVLGLGGGTGTRITVLFGDVRYGSTWWYFPLNILIKNPVPLIAAFALGAFVFARAYVRREGGWQLLLFPVLYTSLAVLEGINVSYRHMLPVHPYLHVMAGLGLAPVLRAAGRGGVPRERPLFAVGRERAAARGAGIRSRSAKGGVFRWRQLRALVAALGALWYVAGTVRITPDELAYFNELVGGPEGAPRVLVDYTQDWGQYFKALAAYLEANPGPQPEVFVFTVARPEHYGIAYDRMEDVARFHPQPGRYALGPGPIYGLVGRGQRLYDWFRHAAPTDFIAHALYIYDVREQVTWLAQCATPVPPLDPRAVSEGFAVETLRRIDFDCTRSWIYPAAPLVPDGGGMDAAPVSATGAYAMHDDLLSREHCGGLGLPPCRPEAKDVFVARHLAQARLAYEQREFQRLPAFALFEEAQRGPVLQPREAIAYPAPIETVPAALAADTAPAAVDRAGLGRRLVFEGVATYPDGDAMIVETWWRSVQDEIAEPFSIFAHLVAEDGRPLGEADGLGLSPLAIASGDIIVQRHAFPRPESSQGLWLRTGVYWLGAPLQRWSVDDHPGADALFIPLDGNLP